MPTNSLSSKLYDPQSSENAYLLKTLCCDVSVPKVEGLIVILLSHFLPVSLVCPNCKSSFFTLSLMKLEHCLQFLQIRCSLNVKVTPYIYPLKFPHSEQTGFRHRLHWCYRTIIENFFWQSLQFFYVPLAIYGSFFKSEFFIWGNSVIIQNKEIYFIVK